MSASISVLTSKLSDAPEADFRTFFPIRRDAGPIPLARPRHPPYHPPKGPPLPLTLLFFLTFTFIEPCMPTFRRLPTDQLLYHGTRVDLVLRTVTTNTGKSSTREVCLHPGAVIILPVLDDGRFVLIRNRRHTVNETLLELPAGTLEYAVPTADSHPGDATEDPAHCAARELTEETGYTAREMIPFGWFYTSPGILTEKMFAFVAKGLTPGPQKLEDNEQIETELFTQSEILRLIRENGIVDAKTIATLLKYFSSTNVPEKNA